MYSLWLIPEDTAFIKYSEVIEGFSKNLKAPYFEPHITLLGGIKNIDDKTMYELSVLAAVTDRFKVKLYQLAFQKAYFRCFYLLAKKNRKLCNLYQEALQIFKEEKDVNNYMPHLSLIYKNMEVSQKKKLIKKLGHSLYGNIQIQSIRLVQTQGKVEDWKLVEEFPLWRKGEKVGEDLAFLHY